MQVVHRASAGSGLVGCRGGAKPQPCRTHPQDALSAPLPLGARVDCDWTLEIVYIKI